MGIKVHNTQDNTFKDNTHNTFNANFKHIQHSYQDVIVFTLNMLPLTGLITWTIKICLLNISNTRLTFVTFVALN